MRLFRFCFFFLQIIQNKRKSKEIKSKKIERFCKGAENSKFPKSFQIRISLNKKMLHKTAANIKIQT